MLITIFFYSYKMYIIGLLKVLLMQWKGFQLPSLNVGVRQMPLFSYSLRKILAEVFTDPPPWNFQELSLGWVWVRRRQGVLDVHVAIFS